jgi:hypothetical protein
VGDFGAQASTGEAIFHEATGLSDDNLARVQAQVRRRVLTYLARHDYLDEEVVATMLAWRHSGGFSLDASVRLAAWDRQGLERLARYCARPSFAGARLDRLNDETLAYRLKKPLADGSTCLYLTPLELLTRLAALIPPPRQHRTRYYGVFAPNAGLRQAVIATAGPGEALAAQLREAAVRMELDGEARMPVPETPRASRGEHYVWAMLLARIYDCLPLLCKRCGQAMKILAFVTEASQVRRILEHVGEPAMPLPLAPSRAPPQMDFSYDQDLSDHFDQRSKHGDETW